MSETRTGVNRTRTDRTRTNSSTEVQGPNRWYLLFAGSEPSPRGGLGDLVQIFSSDETARNVFREMRLAGGSAARWAQLAVVDGTNGIQPLCWFGIGATPNQNMTLWTRQSDVSSWRTRTSRLRSSRFRSPG
jgi:hypothetical protein